MCYQIVDRTKQTKFGEILVCEQSERGVGIELTYLHVNWLMEWVWIRIIRLMKIPGDSALSEICTPSSPSSKRFLSDSVIICRERTWKRIIQGKSDWLDLQRQHWSARANREQGRGGCFYPWGGKMNEQKQTVLSRTAGTLGWKEKEGAHGRENNTAGTVWREGVIWVGCYCLMTFILCDNVFMPVR